MQYLQIIVNNKSDVNLFSFQLKQSILKLEVKNILKIFQNKYQEKKVANPIIVVQNSLKCRQIRQKYEIYKN